MKWSASSGTSSTRSRRGGTEIGTTLRRKYRSSRNRPARISAGRSLLVAASTRASTRIWVELPTASMTCSCSTRSTLACVFRLMSPISSRKIVPPWATSNLPRRSATAPVKAPRTWPNSSLSISSSGNGGAVHLDERPRPAPAHRVNVSRDQLLSGAVLAEDQHAAVGRRSRRHLLAQPHHDVAVADHQVLRVHLRSQREILGFETPLPERVPDDEHRLLEGERLFDEIERPHLDRPDCGLDVAVARDDHHLRVELALAHPRQRRQPVHPGKPDVEQHDVVGLTGQSLKARLAAVDGIDAVALVPKHAAERAAHARLVIDDQNGRHPDFLSFMIPASGVSDSRSTRQHVPFESTGAGSRRSRSNGPQQGNSIANRVPRG